MAKAKGPSPQPWQVAASATAPPGSALSNTGGARPSEDLLRPAADAGAKHPAPAPPPPAPVPTDPKGFQQYLKNRGANLGRSGPNKDGVDGIIGPKTLAEAARLGVAVPPELAPPPSPAPAPAPPSAPEPPAPAAAAAEPEVTAPQLPASPTANMDDATLAQYFGYGTWVLQIPELKAILDRYATSQTDGTPMTVDELRTAVEGSNYFRTTSQTQRDFTKLQTEDPTSAQAKIDAQTAYIKQQGANLGVTIDPGRAQQMATDAIRFGWNPSQLEQAIGSEFHYVQGGQSGVVGRQELGIKQIAGDYLVPVSDGTLQQWDQQIAASNGRLTSEDFRTYLAEQAKTLYPTLAAQIDKGLTTNQLVDPYRQIAAKELGINPESIDFTQPKWLSLISAPTDPKTGERQMMSLAGATQKIRSDETYGWDKSQNGVATYYQAGNALTAALGVRA